MKKLLVAAIMLGLTLGANANLLMDEHFTYANGVTTNVSAGVWTRHSGTADNSFINNNALEVFSARADDVNRSLGATYSSGNLYYALDLSLATQPTAAGTYFAHLQTGTTLFRDRLFVNSSGAVGGGYFVGIGNTSSGQIMWSTELGLATIYTLVVRSDLDNDISYLWVNPASEASANIFTNIASTVDPSAFGFRQAAGEGNITVDNLRVGTTFSDVIPEPGSLALIGVAVGVLAFLRKRG